MTDAAETVEEDRIAGLEAELRETRAELVQVTEQLERVGGAVERLEPLLRAALKRAPKRAATPARPPERARQLSDERAADVLRRMNAPKRKRSRKA